MVFLVIETKKVLLYYDRKVSTESIKCMNQKLRERGNDQKVTWEIRYEGLIINANELKLIIETREATALKNEGFNTN